MIEQALMNVALGRFPASDPRVRSQLSSLVSQGMVLSDEDGWKLTDEGLDFLAQLGWEQKWCRFEPWGKGKGMRPGVFDTVDDARASDIRWCQLRGADRALIRPVFVNEEQEHMYT